MIFTDLIERNASTLPDAVAVRGGETSFTWSELARASRRLAGGLRALGAGPRDRVAILARCCAGYLVAIHGAAWGGQILVPLNTRLAGPELVAQLEDSDARIILVDAAHMHATADWPDRWRRRIVRISGDGRIAVEAAEIRERYAFAPGDTVTILYTGGTTGRAKGVELSSIAMLENGRIVADMLELAQRDISLLTAPLFHISGSGMVWATAVTGAGCAPVPAFSPAAVCRALGETGTTTIFLAPTMIQMLLDDPCFDPVAFENVRNLMYGASSISEALLKRVLATLPGVRLLQAYGQTEICPITLLRHEDHLRALAESPAILRSAGKAVEGVRLKIVTPDGREARPGEAGVVHASGGAVMNGYFNLPEQTRATLVDGYVNTGDIGRLDEEGYLTLVDRAKDMIVTGGENVYSAEVENILNAHPNVAHAAVIAVPDAKWGERVHAVVELKKPTSHDTLGAFCRASLAGYKCPKSYEEIDAMPLTPAGKIDKKPLREKYWAGKKVRIS